MTKSVSEALLQPDPKILVLLVIIWKEMPLHQPGPRTFCITCIIWKQLVGIIKLIIGINVDFSGNDILECHLGKFKPPLANNFFPFLFRSSTQISFLMFSMSSG